MGSLKYRFSTFLKREQSVQIYPLIEWQNYKLYKNKIISCPEKMSGIYIHVPFCKRACHYCNFHFSTSLGHIQAMVHAICKELYLQRGFLKGQNIRTIYFGGGTPSLLDTNQIALIFHTLQKYFTLEKDTEITLEANPDDLSPEKIQQFYALGINRLSIGVQSFFDEDLRKINRTHTALQAHNAIAHSQKYFENITVDLMYGLPEMSCERWRTNLRKAFDFQVPHLSCYALTVEEKTALAHMIQKKKYPSLNEEKAFEHFQILMKESAEKGFVHYEISNFAKHNFFSKHNRAYWRGNFYLGVGPSAHSFDGRKRYWNVASNPEYIKALKDDRLVFTEETLRTHDLYNEYIMLGLRTREGVDLNLIKKRFGKMYYKYLTQRAAHFLENETLKIQNQFLCATNKGKFLVDGIAADLFFIEQKNTRCP